MDIEFVGHASVIVNMNNKKILTDPWFSGRVFNDSWSLFPKFKVDIKTIESVDYLWISHEHPDHFHFPTLKSFSDEFKQKVTVLFQEKHTDRIPKALKKLGFANIVTLKHRQKYELSDGLFFYNYQVGHLDSSLAIFNSESTVLNVNDCTISPSDCDIILRDISKVDILLHQFSIAHYPGFIDHETILNRMRENKLKDMLSCISSFKPDFIIPFASFVYFCCEDNKFINDYANSIRDCFDILEPDKAVVLYPGEKWNYKEIHDNVKSLEMYEKSYSKMKNLDFFHPKSVSLSQIKIQFTKFIDDIFDKYPKFLIRLLKPMSVKFYDLGIVIIYDIRNRKIGLSKKEIEPDLIMHSQCFSHGIENDWGFSTLTVGGRIKIIKNNQSWVRHRIFYTLRHAEIFLKIKYILTTKTLHHVIDRLGGIFGQLIYKTKRLNP